LEADIAARYIGRPYVPGGRGPNGFDCVGLCLYVYGHELGLELDELYSAGNKMRRMERPASMCIVDMRTPTGNSHAGLWLSSDGGGILHCIMPLGVIFSRLNGFDAIGTTIRGYYGVA